MPSKKMRIGVLCFYVQNEHSGVVTLKKNTFHLDIKH